MTRQFKIRNGDFYLTFDLSSANKIGLQKWGRLLKLTSEYAPDQLDGAAKYLEFIINNCTGFYRAAKEQYGIAEASARIGAGKKRDAAMWAREVKLLKKELTDWEKRLSYVERTLDRLGEKRSA